MKKNNLKIVKLKAGLGNQMFQYAFGILLKRKYGIADLKYDVSYYCFEDFKKYYVEGITKLNISLPIADDAEIKKRKIIHINFKPKTLFSRAASFVEKTFNKKYYLEKNRAYVNPETILQYDYFDGYWQSWKYLDEIRDELLKAFKPKNLLSFKTTNAISLFSKMNSVFVGVRKGDYQADRKSKKHFGSCSLTYYSNAIKIIKSQVNNPVFVFFSDDIEWTKNNLILQNMGLTESEVYYREKEDITNNFEELFVMASCKHAIISNSTFNFWGAWLINNKEKIVIGPKHWFNDNSPINILPDEWIKIENGERQ